MAEPQTVEERFFVELLDDLVALGVPSGEAFEIARTRSERATAANKN
jgi:hypothetical protein